MYKIALHITISKVSDYFKNGVNNWRKNTSTHLKLYFIVFINCVSEDMKLFQPQILSGWNVKTVLSFFLLLLPIYIFSVFCLLSHLLKCMVSERAERREWSLNSTFFDYHSSTTHSTLTRKNIPTYNYDNYMDTHWLIQIYHIHMNLKHETWTIQNVDRLS